MRSWDITLALPAAAPIVVPLAPLPTGTLIPCVVAAKVDARPGDRRRAWWEAALSRGLSADRGLRLIEIRVGTGPYAVTWWVAGAVVYGGETYLELLDLIAGRKAQDQTLLRLFTRGDLLIHDARRDGCSPLVPVRHVPVPPLSDTP